jgi:hypothetical protein
MNWADSLVVSKAKVCSFFLLSKPSVNEIPPKSNLPGTDEDESPSEGSLEESQSETSEQHDSDEEWNGITQNESVITSGQESAEQAEIPLLQPAQRTGVLHPAKQLPTSLTRLQAPTYLHIYERFKNLIQKPFRSSRGS